MEATVEAVVEAEKGAATTTGATGANASVEVANRQIAERMATILFMVIVVFREDDSLVGKVVMVWAATILIWMLKWWSLHARLHRHHVDRHGGKDSRNTWQSFPPFRTTCLPAISRHFSYLSTIRRSTIDDRYLLATGHAWR